MVESPDMDIIFFDTETTGNQSEDRLCQIAWKQGGKETCLLFKPPVPISIDSMAVHHITDKMVEDRPLFTDSPEWNDIKTLFESDTAIPVAHNASFDIDMLKKENIEPKQHICTLKVARYLDEEAKLPKYNLQYLRYALGLEVEATAHDALGDVKVLELLFDRLLKKMVERHGDEKIAVQEMVRISSLPSLIHMFNFGKHAGKKVADVAQEAPDYLEWLLKQKLESDIADEDWIFTLKTHLGKK